MTFWRVGSAVLTSLALCAAPVAADPIIESSAEAEAAESGEQEEIDTDSDETTVAGETATAQAYRCLGAAACDLLPGQIQGGIGSARTNFGSNHASSYAESGYSPTENDVVDYASARSYWADEWTFDVAPSAVGEPVLLDFHIDGSWGNDGYARFMAAVGQRVVPPPVLNPEDPPPLLQPDVVNVAGIDFQSTHGSIIAWPGLVLIPNPDGGETDGSIDVVLTISFVPTDGSEWVVQGLLLVESSKNFLGGVAADFDSTAELVRVVVPAGVSFTSAAGASYDVVVPEPGVALLVGLAALGAALARRGAPAIR